MKIAAVTVYLKVGDDVTDMWDACHNARSIADVVKANILKLPGFIESEVTGIVETEHRQAGGDPEQVQFHSGVSISKSRAEYMERLAFHRRVNYEH